MTKPLITLVMVLLAVLLGGCVGYDQPASPNWGLAMTPVPDIYRDADVAQATLMAAGMQMTATSQAAQMTQQAVAFEATATAEAYQVQATRQAWEATATAQAYQATSTAEVQSTQQALVVQSTQQSMAVQATKQALDLGRKQMTNVVVAVTPLALLWLVVVYGMVVAWRLLKVRPIRRDPNGDAPILDINGRILYDPDRNPVPALVAGNEPSAPMLVDQALQARVTATDQAVDGVRAMGHRGETIYPPATAPAGEETAIEAQWRDVDTGWSGRGSALLLGMGAQGAIPFVPERTPHLMVAGTTGSGKTMGLLRPLAAMALAQGWRVMVINPAGADFAPLAQHPNCQTVDAAGAADALEWGAAEVARRSQMLAQAGISTWAGLPADERPERLMLAVDELVALAWGSEPSMAARIWAAAIMITSQGRKLGISLAAATTDPTNRTLGRPGLTVRDNCTVAAFRVRDESVSRAALGIGGAEGLGQWRFMVRMAGQVITGAAFHPGDDELKTFLLRRAAPALGQVEIPQRLEAGMPDETRLKIIDLKQRGVSINGICRALYGYTGGQAYEDVKAVLDDAAITTTITTAMTGGTPGDAAS